MGPHLFISLLDAGKEQGKYLVDILDSGHHGTIDGNGICSVADLQNP